MVRMLFPVSYAFLTALAFPSGFFEKKVRRRFCLLFFFFFFPFAVSLRRRKCAPRPMCLVLCVFSALGSPGGRLSDIQEKEIRNAFAMVDRDGSGAIELAELKQVLRAVLGEDPSDDVAQRLFNLMDIDHSGTIELSEFMKLQARTGISEVILT